MYVSGFITDQKRRAVLKDNPGRKLILQKIKSHEVNYCTNVESTLK